MRFLSPRHALSALLALALLLAAGFAFADRVAIVTIQHPTEYEDGSPLSAVDIVTTRTYYARGIDGEWFSGGETSGDATNWDIRLSSDFACGRVYVRVVTERCASPTRPMWHSSTRRVGRVSRP
jgi:hypothetical protein